MRSSCVGLAASGLLACAASAAGVLQQRAPDFALAAFQGDNVRLSEYRGQPVVLSFWNSRCGTCAKQLQELDRLYGTYRSAGLIVLAVGIDDDPQRAADYASDHHVAFPLLFDQTKSVARAYDVARLPSTLLIDRSGIVRYLHSDDGADDRTLVRQVRELLDDRLGNP
jgi:peroxiredoxin